MAVLAHDEDLRALARVPTAWKAKILAYAIAIAMQHLSISKVLLRRMLQQLLALMLLHVEACIDFGPRPWLEVVVRAVLVLVLRFGIAIIHDEAAAPRSTLLLDPARVVHLRPLLEIRELI